MGGSFTPNVSFVLRQADVVSTLTVTQFGAVQAFAGAASKILFEIVVKGETAAL